MNYDFSNFSPGEFEHLIQSLLQKRLGDTSKVFGLGPDGARELTFEGKADYPNSIECLEGYWVVQVKFKIRDFGVEDKFSWLKRSVKEDLEKFLDEKRKLKIPNNYLFYTNIILTPIHKTGGRDKIEEFLVKYKKIIPNIFIFSYDEICRLLDNNRDVRLTYSNLLLTSDLIASLLAKKEIVDDYDDYKKLKKEILVLKKSTSIKDEKIKVLERKLKSFSDTILDLRKLIEVKSNSTLFNKAKWLFLVEKDINAALKLLSEDKLEQEELDIARIRIYKAKLFFAKFDFINCEVQYKKAISIIDNYETNFEYGNYLHSMNYNRLVTV